MLPKVGRLGKRRLKLYSSNKGKDNDPFLLCCAADIKLNVSKVLARCPPFALTAAKMTA